ncbi:MAG TPA: AAA family ATPase, partial [Aggregatilineales bacterium]|nr:AAA family ATPase [Aggregatilineales bacterium]
MFAQLQPDAVANALEAVRKAVPLQKTHPLLQFASLGGVEALVEDRLLHVISVRLNRIRKAYGDVPAAPQHALDGIVQDFRHQNSDLEAWSLLYYRYVRTEFDMSIERLEKLVGQDRRTLNRRQQKGIVRLTHVLIRRERRYRHRSRTAALTALLPSSRPPRLVGRTDALVRAFEALRDGGQPRHVLVYGPAGIGKSALALALAHQLVPSIANLAWIEEPAGQLEALLEQIALRLNVTQVQAPLAAYLHLVDSLIVIDSADDLESMTLDRLLSALGAARVIICRRALPPLRGDITPIALQELDKEGAFDLVEHCAVGGPRPAPEQIERWYDDLGGNPGALRQAVTAPRGYDPAAISLDLYRRTWASLPDEARLDWLILGLCPNGTLASSVFAAMILRQPSPDLLATWVVESPVDPYVALAPLAYRFTDTSPDPALHTRAVRLRASFLAEHPDPTACLTLLQRTQLANLSRDVQIDLAYTFEPTLTRAGAWRAWGGFLDALLPLVPDSHRAWAALHLGIARRWLGDLNDATALLTEAMSRAGQTGDFTLQADAMLELAAIYRLQGRTELYESLLTRAEAVYRRYNQSDGLARSVALRLQTLLESGAVGEAWEGLRGAEKEFDAFPP